jgi:hypothetical protein
MRNISGKNHTENEKHAFYVQKRFPENRAVFEIMWQTTDDIIRRMRTACWIPKATNIHS